MAALLADAERPHPLPTWAGCSVQNWGGGGGGGGGGILTGDYGVLALIFGLL